MQAQAHVCTQDDRIRRHESRIVEVEVKYETQESLLRDIKAWQFRLMWTLIGSMGVAILNLLILLWTRR
jgi:hypothetical protein